MTMTARGAGDLVTAVLGAGYLPRLTAVHLGLILMLLLTSLRSGLAILCSQCDTEQGQEECWYNPPPPKNCTQSCSDPPIPNLPPEQCLQFSEYKFCIIVRQVDENNTVLEVSRDCSPIGGKERCYHGTHSVTHAPMKMCHSYCNTDGCNSASVLSASVWTGLIFSLLVTILHW